MPIAETTIEVKNQAVTMEKDHRSIGALRVSLANRLPMLEQMLWTDPACFIPTLDSFTEARALTTHAAYFDIAGHPLLRSQNKFKI